MYISLCKRLTSKTSLKDNLIWHLHWLSTGEKYGKFKCHKHIHFKTQHGPVAKNATPRPPDRNRTEKPGSLDQRSTD